MHTPGFSRVYEMFGGFLLLGPFGENLTQVGFALVLEAGRNALAADVESRPSADPETV